MEGTQISPNTFVLRPPLINNKIYCEVRELGRQIEEKFNLSCGIVYNPYRIGFGKNSVPLSILLFSKIDKIDERLSRTFSVLLDSYYTNNDIRDWRCHRTLITSDILEKWFSRFKGREERFPLMDMAMGADLISYALYGEALMAMLRSRAEKFFRRDIIDFWYKEAIRRNKEKEKRLEEFYKQQVAYMEERRRLLNKYELGEIREFLKYVEKRQVEKPFKLIVALDGSGRPLGKALGWYLKNSADIIHFAPYLLRKIGVTDFPLAEKILQHEFPRLYSTWKNNPEDILFIDDQTGYGNTGTKMLAFTKFLSGNKNAFRLLVMSQYEKNNTPSWLHNRKIQGIKVFKDEFTFRSEERPSITSLSFYNQLQIYVNDWRYEADAHN